MQESSLPLRSKARLLRTRKQVSVTIPQKRDSIPFDRYLDLVESYLVKGDIERHSAKTLINRRYRLLRLLWLGLKRGWKQIGPKEIAAFFVYLNHGHTEGVGRWDNPYEKEPLKPGSVKSFHSSIRSFFRWLVAEDELDISPIEKIAVPIDRADQIVPFTEAQVDALRIASKKTMNPLRDEAIVTLLVDTGLRVSELIALTLGDIDWGTGQVIVREGKGGKSRAIPFGRNCKRALWNYVQNERRQADKSEPLFISDRGIDAGVYALTPRGVALLVKRLGVKAKIPPTVRCSPHTFRHTFACLLLRNGANVFALKSALGHSAMLMVNRYVAISQADLIAAHRLASPADRLRTHKDGK